MTTRHTITTRLNVSRLPFGEPGTTTIEVEIAYSYQPRKLSDALQVTVIAATLIDDGDLPLIPQHVFVLAQEFLDGDGYDAACRRAEAQAA